VRALPSPAVGTSPAILPIMRLSLLTVVLALAPAACIFGGDDVGGTGAFCGGFTGQTCTEQQYCDYPDQSCGAADGSGTCRIRPQVCAEIYAPVTGSDGKKYGNACLAHAAGADDCGGSTPGE
jgi:hypothetical protein